MRFTTFRIRVDQSGMGLTCRTRASRLRRVWFSNAGLGAMSLRVSGVCAPHCRAGAFWCQAWLVLPRCDDRYGGLLQMAASMFGASPTQLERHAGALTNMNWLCAEKKSSQDTNRQTLNLAQMQPKA